MSSLSDRLARLRRTGASPIYRSAVNGSPVPGRRDRPGGIAPPGDGWTAAAPDVWERTLVLPLRIPDRIVSRFIIGEPIAGDQLLFYDLETTGLSGGTGNVAFLIGIGRPLENRFMVIQLFLADYPAEPAFLECFTRLTENAKFMVSYNGKSFDSQVLRTRFLLNRIPPPVHRQVDLLHPSRRLWKTRLPEVSLGAVERSVLGIVRTDDLPGSEAPDAWFRWLSGDPDRIGGVFRHNADDISSMARLLVHLEMLADPISLGDHSAVPSVVPPSALGMAVQWASTDTGKCREWLERGWARGERDCGPRLAGMLKREGRWEDAAGIWSILAAGEGGVRARIELAKYAEHRERDPLKALRMLDMIEPDTAGPRLTEELQHRRRRLEGKAARQIRC